jgi:hypothetical protein
MLVITAVAWYTLNVARVAWRDGNKSGAVTVGILAVVAFLMPTLVLFWHH